MADIGGKARGFLSWQLFLPCDPAIPFLGFYLDKTIIQKDTWTPMVTAALFTRAKTNEQPKCPSTDEWIEMWYIHTMKYYSAIRKNDTCIYPDKTFLEKDTCTHMFIAALFTIAKTWKQPKYPSTDD